MNRYAQMFDKVRAEGRRGAFIPFFMLGDPDVETSLALLEAAVAAGADALELGIPFSDPVADGPVIQAAAERALGSGVRPSSAFQIVARFRAAHPEVPVGLLVYANLVFGPGVEVFYERTAVAGADSVLVADVPVREGTRFVAAARTAGVSPVFIAPADASPATLRRVAEMSEGYTYCLARSGVTGADDALTLSHDALFQSLREFKAPPPVLGFGIATPAHVRAALDAGAAGAISGSAVVKRVQDHLGDRPAMLRAVGEFVAAMRAATER
ncbi:MAG: tryptophan synthase subunit alpha [Polyangiaceae bacterium]|nr:tryptophan synthase subunit alpha [Polyangiaceae bacterium]